MKWFVIIVRTYYELYVHGSFFFTVDDLNLRLCGINGKFEEENDILVVDLAHCLARASS